MSILVDGALAGALTLPMGLLGFAPPMISVTRTWPDHQFYEIVAMCVPGGLVAGLGCGVVAWVGVRGLSRFGPGALLTYGPVVTALAAVASWFVVSASSSASFVPRSRDQWEDLALFVTLIVVGAAPVWVGWVVARARGSARGGWLAASSVWAASVGALGAIVLYLTRDF